MINCLEYCLEFNKINKDYKIYYNGDHCINSNKQLGGNFLPIERYGLMNIYNSFKGVVSDNVLRDLCYYFYRLENPNDGIWMHVHIIHFVPKELKYLFYIYICSIFAVWKK